MAKIQVEEVKTYSFEMPDRAEKYPKNLHVKGEEELVSQLFMINKAIDDIRTVLDTVNWKMIVVDPRLTVTFIESKTGLEMSLKKFLKVKNAIEKEIENVRSKEEDLLLWGD